MSKVLWWVTNGRAAAPPGVGCKMGVSTSIQPWSLKFFRMARIIFDRVMNVDFTFSLTTKST